MLYEAIAGINLVDDVLVELLPAPEDIREYIELLKQLPCKILENYSFLPQLRDEKKFIGHLAKNYAVLANWMKYLLLYTYSSLDLELYFSQKIALKPRAELSKSILDIAIELLPRCQELQENFRNPADIWLHWELQILDNYFFSSGLLTGKPIKQPSKENMARVARAVASFLEGESREWTSPTVQNFRLNVAIILLAERTSRDDYTFRISRAYREYIKKTRSYAKAIRSGDTAFLLIEDGKILPSGRNAKRK